MQLSEKNVLMDAEVTIIGAGVIGLAIAEKVTEEYSNVFLIENHQSFGHATIQPHGTKSANGHKIAKCASLINILLTIA